MAAGAGERLRREAASAGTPPTASVHYGEEQFALEALVAGGTRAAQALAREGFGPGDVVALVLRNAPVYVEALTCLRCLDAVLVLVPWHLTARELQPIFAAVAPRLILVHADLLGPVAAANQAAPAARLVVVDTPAQIVAAFGLAAAPVAAPPADALHWAALTAGSGTGLPVPARTLQAIAVSSGSTGAAKIIRRDGRQRWRQWAAQCTEAWPAVRRSIVTAPLYHTGQYGVFSQACQRQAEVVLLPRFEPQAFLAAVERHRINHAYLGPPMFVQLLRLPPAVRERYDVSSLDYVVQTGAPCAPAIKRQMIDWLGPVIWEVYGASECSLIAACSSHEWLARPGTVGRPLRGVVILDEQGRPCPAGQDGEIFVDISDMPALRYQNATVRRRDLDGTEFVSMGDRGRLDADGTLAVTGRTDEVINNGRLKVYPEEIEHALLRHPHVLDCVVFAIPDAVYGQAVAAAVTVTDPDADLEAELRTGLRGELSEHKIPVRIWTRTEPLRLGAGKVNRQALARRLLGGG